MDRGLVLERHNPKVAIPEFWNASPESETIAVLPFYAKGALNNRDTPFTTQIGALPKNDRLEISSEPILGHRRKVRPASLICVTSSLRRANGNAFCCGAWS